jgi:hypothetical protein
MGTRYSTTSRRLLLATVLACATGLTAPALGAPQQAQTTPTTATSTSTASTSSPDADKLPVSLDRIREQLAREPQFSLNLLHALDIPLFRTETRSDLVFRPDPNYWKDDDVGAYVRPGVNRWDYDLMKIMNPNVPTGYGPGGGVDVLPAIQSAFTGMRHAFQGRTDAQVRKQIQDELRQINENRRAAGLPPLDDTSSTPNGRQLTQPNQDRPDQQPDQP